MKRGNLGVNAFRAETEAEGRGFEHERSLESMGLEREKMVNEFQSKLIETDQKTERERIKSAYQMGRIYRQDVVADEQG